MSDQPSTGAVPEGQAGPLPGRIDQPDRTRPIPSTGPVPRTGPQEKTGATPKIEQPVKLSPPTGTRASYTWLALTAAAIGLVLLIIFILQNTQTVTVTFLWLQGSLPLAVALLIAGVATLILTLAVGAARILQLRRFSRKAAKRSNKLAAPTRP